MTLQLRSVPILQSTKSMGTGIALKNCRRVSVNLSCSSSCELKFTAQYESRNVSEMCTLWSCAQFRVSTIQIIITRHFHTGDMQMIFKNCCSSLRNQDEWLERKHLLVEHLQMTLTTVHHAQMHPLFLLQRLIKIF